MKNKLLSASVLLAFCMNACNNDDVMEASFDTIQIPKADVLVLQERENYKDVQLTQEKIVKKDLKVEFIPGEPLYLLGRSFKERALPLSNTKNLGFQIIDIENFSKDYKYGILEDAVLSTNVDYFSYNEFESYEEKSSYGAKTSAGGGLNLGLLKFSAKQTINGKFSKTVLNQSNLVYGELNVNYEGYSYKLQNTSSVKKAILKKYLYKPFIDDLYDQEIYKNIDLYGTHVLTSFNSGGHLTAYYVGKHKETSTVTGKELDMQQDINASFSIKKIGANASGGLGINYSNSISKSNKFSSMYTSIETEGGIPGTTITIPESPLANVNISFDEWLKSFTDKKYHKIASINDGGLTSITDFIVEENFKRQVEDYCSSLGQKYAKNEQILGEPTINVLYMPLSAYGQSSIKTTFIPEIALKTRTGKVIYLQEAENYKFINEYSYNGFKEQDRKKLREICVSKTPSLVSEEIASYFKCKVVAYTMVDVLMAFISVDQISKEYPLPTISAFCNFRSAKKYEDKERGYKYILMEKDDRKYVRRDMPGMHSAMYCTMLDKDIALSIYDDYILDTYGIREWYEKIPSVDLTYDKIIDNYSIIGL